MTSISDMPSPSDTPTRPADLHSFALPLLLSCLAYALLFHLVSSTQLIPGLQKLGNVRPLVWLSLFLSLGPFMLLQILMVRYLTSWQSEFPKRLLAVALSAAAWGGLLVVSSSADGTPGLVLGMILGPWINLALIATTVLIGSFISLAIKEAAVLLPVLLVSGMVDYWGVYFGTTHQFVQNAPEVVERVSARVPVISLGGIAPPPTIGPGDFVFLGIFFACLHRFHMDVKRTFWSFAVLLVIALGIVMWADIPIPGLVPMAIAMVAVNFRDLKLSRSELFATIYVVLFLGAVLLGLTIWGPFNSGPPAAPR